MSDLAIEDSLHDVPLLCEFAWLDGSEERLLDESSILGFRHLLRQYELAAQKLKTDD